MSREPKHSGISRMYLPKNPIAVAKRFARAALVPATPALVQMVVIRRCNLSCGYCNEYDDHSDPLALDKLYQRIDHLAEIGHDHGHAHRRRAAAAPGPGQAHRAGCESRYGLHDHHQWLSSHAALD